MSFFETHRDIHVKVTKQAHTQFRTLLFQKNLSMQEVFEEFVQLVVAEDARALKMLDQLVTKKAQAKLDKVKKKPTISELDHETLYDLLENQSPLGKTEEEDT